MGHTTSSLTSNGNLGNKDAVIIKYSAAGEIQWIKQFGDSQDDVCNSIAIDSSDNVYCSGTTYSNYVENSGSFPNSTTSDIFVIKMNSDGLVQWKKQFGKESEILQYISTSANNENGYGITIDSAGSVLVAGSSDGSFVNNGAGNQDAVILKLNPANGDLVWGRQFGGVNNDRCHSVVTDSDNYVYCGGFTEGDFGTLTANSLNSGTNALVIKVYPDDGNFVWASRVGNVAGDHSSLTPLVWI